MNDERRKRIPKAIPTNDGQAVWSKENICWARDEYQPVLGTKMLYCCLRPTIQVAWEQMVMETFRRNIEPEPLTMETVNRLLEQIADAPSDCNQDDRIMVEPSLAIWVNLVTDSRPPPRATLHGVTP